MLVLVGGLLLAAPAVAQDAGAEGDQNMAAGRFTLAAMSYRRAFDTTADPTFLKKAGQAHLAMGPVGREEAIRAFRQYVQSARTLAEAQEGEALLKQAEATAPAATPTPPPAPAPVPAPTPTAPAGVVAAAQPAAPAPAPVAAGTAAAPAPAPAPAEVPEKEPPGATGPRSSWFGKEGSFVISAERLSMLSAFKTRVVVGSDESTYSGTDVSLLGNSSGVFTPQVDGVVRVSTVPRLGLDYFQRNRLSLGGWLGWTSRSASLKEGMEKDLPSTSTFFVGARGGYYLPLTDAVGGWLRGGLSYVSSSTTDSSGSQESSVKISEVMINLDATAVFPIFPHVALTAGAFLDGSLTGTATTKSGGMSADNDIGELAYGVTVGLTGFQ